MHIVPRAPRALPASLATIGSTIALMGVGADLAKAAGSSLYADGLHLSTGALVDPAGRTWVADHNAGFCRVKAPSDTAAGAIEHPQTPDAPGNRTCLGGLLPDAATGPDAAGAPALFDPSPDRPGSGDELAFIPDGASASSEVVRAAWNPHTELFEYRDTITMQGDRGRPTAVSLGPDQSLYVTFQRESTLQRISDLDAAFPTVEIVGRPADDRGPVAIAAGRDADGELAVYVVETTGLRVLRPDAITRPLTEPAPFAVPDGLGVSALAYDGARDLLWAGTSDGVLPEDIGVDELIRIDTRTNAVERDHTTGFSSVGGLAVRPEGHVMVLDDPGLVDGEPIGTGRMFHVGLPAAHVGSGARFTSDTTPTFAITGDGTPQCLLRGPGTDTGWNACADGSFELSRALVDGDYVLSARAVQDGVTGLPEAYAFTVDTRAPLRPVVVRPADGSTVSATPWYELAAETHASFACRFDAEEAFTPCAPGRTRSFEGAGEHTLQITATDRAGNVSEPSTAVTFTVDPDLQPTTPPGWGDGPITGRGSSLYSTGLHIPTGAIVDPNGRLWVADHNAGFCRVGAPGEDGPATIEHPQVPGGAGPHTCLGGLLPEALPGADAAGQPTLVDPSPTRPGSGDEVVLVPDGASPSSEVHRATWNPDSGLFEPLDTVATISADADKGTRPVATSLGPDGAVYVVFQREGSIQRISSPAGPNPIARVVGITSDGRGSSAVAAGRNAAGQLTVWVAEKEGLAVLSPNATNPPQTTPSSIVVPVPANAAEPVSGIGAMLFDSARGQLWIGTADAAVAEDIGSDVVHRYDVASGVLEAGYTTGYTAVGGLGLRSDGMLYVLDDPALVDLAEPLGLGRMYQVGLPAAHVTDGPAHTADTTPTFTVAADAAAWCRLRGPDGLDSGWSPCPEDGAFTPDTPLAEGAHVLTVQARDGEQLGLVEAHRFTVDTIAPAQPSITSPAAGALVNANPWFAFAAEPGVSFTCRWDAETDDSPCEPGYTRTFSENGRRTLQIRATDPAGNVSDPSEPVAFDVRGLVTEVRIEGGPTGRTRDRAPVFTFTADATDVEFSCRLVGRPFAPCNSPKSFGELADGAYTLEVRGRDAAGNVSPVARRTFTVDTTGPVPALAQPAEGAVVGPAFSLALTADEAASWRCRLDAEPFRACSADEAFAEVAPGAHTLQAYGTDDLGNPGAVLTRRFTVRPPAAAPVAPVRTAPAAPAAPVAPAAPAAQQGAPALSLRVTGLDRRITVQEVRAEGLRVAVRPDAGTRVVRLRFFRLGRLATAAAGRKALVTVHRKVRGRTVITLTRRELRRLGPGRYALELTPGKSRTRLGRTTTRRVTITR